MTSRRHSVVTPVLVKWESPAEHHSDGAKHHSRAPSGGEGHAVTAKDNGHLYGARSLVGGCSEHSSYFKSESSSCPHLELRLIIVNRLFNNGRWLGMVDDSRSVMLA